MPKSSTRTPSGTRPTPAGQRGRDVGRRTRRRRRKMLPTQATSTARWHAHDDATGAARPRRGRSTGSGRGRASGRRRGRRRRSPRGARCRRRREAPPPPSRCARPGTGRSASARRAPGRSTTRVPRRTANAGDGDRVVLRVDGRVRARVPPRHVQRGGWLGVGRREATRCRSWRRGSCTVPCSRSHSSSGMSVDLVEQGGGAWVGAAHLALLLLRERHRAQAEQLVDLEGVEERGLALRRQLRRGRRG